MRPSGAPVPNFFVPMAQLGQQGLHPSGGRPAGINAGLHAQQGVSPMQPQPQVWGASKWKCPPIFVYIQVHPSFFDNRLFQEGVHIVPVVACHWCQVQCVEWYLLHTMLGRCKLVMLQGLCPFLLRPWLLYLEMLLQLIRGWYVYIIVDISIRTIYIHHIYSKYSLVLC